MNKWHEIWNKDERINKIILESLIKADGFDSGAGSFCVEDWLDYTNEFYSELDIKKEDTIFDVGCGSGAFVYPLYLKKYKVGGLDYSKILINLANTILKNCDFVCDEAVNLDLSNRYDIVISHSVFHYFKDLEYAKKVIKNMVIKSNKKIAIFDINDKSKEKQYHKIRMSNMDEKEYKEKYAILKHMFYEKSWFEEIAKELGLKIYIFDQAFKKYSNSQLRFNVIMEK
jgi:SAM-dependent methyltransferase